ncbi:MAG: 50S ribosomal protein L4 [Actinomycetaceae bacterium]|nr:50S ribosomal protein L4 [Actinomycetaceae bacterium]
MADFKVDVLDTAGEKTGSVTLSGELFDVEVNVPLLHQVVTAQLAAARKGTHKTKTRGEVRGGGIKPYKQKGTGRARQGSIRAPQFTGGGVVHGPQPRSYAQRTPKKMIKAALLQSLSDRARHDRIHVVTGFVDGATPSTKAALGLLTKVVDDRKALVVLERNEETSVLSLRNLPEAQLIYVDQLNAYDVLVNDDVIFTEAAFGTYTGATNKEETK